MSQNNMPASIADMIERMKRQSGLLSELKRTDEEKDKAKRKEIEQKIAGQSLQKSTVPSSVADTIQRMTRQSDLQTELREAKTDTQRKAVEKKVAGFTQMPPQQKTTESYRSSSIDDTIRRMERNSDLLSELGETQDPNKRNEIEATIAKESGTRNPTTDETLAQDIRDAAKYGDRNILRAKSEEFFSHYDGVLWVPYGQYQLLLMDDKVHVLGNGKDTAFPDTNAALDYVDKQKDYEALADIEELSGDIQSLSRDVTMIRPTHPEYQPLHDELDARLDSLERIGAEIIGTDSGYQIVRYNNQKYVIGNGINDKGYIVTQNTDGKFRVSGTDEDFNTLDEAITFLFNPTGNTDVISDAVKGVSGDETTIYGQGYLSVMGFPIGTYGPNNNGVDGEWGDKGIASTKLFQQMMGLPQTGELDDPTLAKMNEYTNSGLTFKQLVTDAYNNGIRPEIVKGSTQAERINTIYFYALLDEDTSGVPAAITVAQAIQESQAGSRIPIDKHDGTFSYNMFGIKANEAWLNKGGSYVITNTWEHVNGENIRLDAKFRAYDSYLESIADHSRFLTGISRYSSLFSIKRDDQYLSNWTKGLQNAGYATDPHYADRLMSHINEYGLK